MELNKTKLRKKYRKLKINDKSLKDFEINSKLLNLPMINKYDTYIVYHPFKNEPDIHNFIKHLEKEKKIVFTATLDFEIDVPIDVAIIPGLAFDKNRYRLGRGKGWYDRFLSEHPETFKIGVCYKEQLVDKLPTEEHDIKMDLVIYG